MSYLDSIERSARADNEFFQQAKQELGPDASVSAIARRAQELKVAAVQKGK